MGLPTIPSLQEPMAAVPKLDLKVINFLIELIFAAQYTSESIGRVTADIKFNNFPD